MKCAEFLQELTNYLDGVLDDRTKAELEDHLAWCHNCYVVCDTTKKTIEIYRDSQLYELPDDLRNRLRSAIVAKCEAHKKTGPREVADWSPNPEQQYNQAELKEILTKTIQGLPPSFRTVFVLRDVEGLSTEETADALELSIPAVKSRLLRARLQLRERLSRYFQKRESGDGKQ